MKTIFTLIFLFVFLMNSKAQKDSIMHLLKTYHLDEYKIAHIINNRDSKYAFFVEANTKSTVENVKDEKTIARHDPKVESKHHWTLLSINDKKPSHKEIKKFERQKTRLKEDQVLEIESDSWRIEKENDSIVIIEFKFSKKHLPRDIKLLAKCKTHLYLSKKQNRVLYIQTTNEKSFRFKVYKIKKIEIKEQLMFDEKTKLYVTTDEYTKVDLKFLNQIISVFQHKRFYNYKYIE